MRSTTALLIVLMSLLLVSLTTAQDVKPRVAILTLEANGVSKTEASIATQYLATELTRQGRFEVLEREYMASVMEEQVFSLTFTDVDSAVEIGRLLAAERVVVGSVTASEGSYILNVRMLDVEAGKVIASTTESCSASSSALSKLAKDVGKRTYADRIDKAAENGWLWWALGGVAAAGATTVYLMTQPDADAPVYLPNWPILPPQ